MENYTVTMIIEMVKKLADLDCSKSASIEDRERYDLIIGLLKQLPRPWKQAIGYKYYAGYDYASIAAKMHKSEITIKRYVRDGLKQVEEDWIAAHPQEYHYVCEKTQETA